MAKQINVGVGGVVKKVSKVPISIGGVVKQVKKWVCGVGGVVKEFFTSSIISSVTKNNVIISTNDGTKISFTNNDTSKAYYLYIYGDFGGKTFSVKGLNQGKQLTCYAVNSSGTKTAIGYWKEDDTSWVTHTGTFASDITHVYYYQSTFSETYGTNRGTIYSFIVDGQELLSEISALV